MTDRSLPWVRVGIAFLKMHELDDLTLRVWLVLKSHADAEGAIYLCDRQYLIRDITTKFGRTDARPIKRAIAALEARGLLIIRRARGVGRYMPPRRFEVIDIILEKERWGRVPVWPIGYRNLSRLALKTFVAMCCHANANNGDRCNASRKTLAEVIGGARLKSISDAVAQLEDFGCIEQLGEQARNRGRHSTKTYVIKFECPPGFDAFRRALGVWTQTERLDDLKKRKAVAALAVAADAPLAVDSVRTAHKQNLLTNILKQSPYPPPPPLIPSSARADTPTSAAAEAPQGLQADRLRLVSDIGAAFHTNKSSQIDRAQSAGNAIVIDWCRGDVALMTKFIEFGCVDPAAARNLLVAIGDRRMFIDEFRYRVSRAALRDESEHRAAPPIALFGATEWATGTGLMSNLRVAGSRFAP